MTFAVELALSEALPWEPTIRPTFAEIDLKAMVANAQMLKRIAGCALYGVVKADAYGHGACQVALALQKSQAVVGFAVSLVEEAIELRKDGVTFPILVMGPSLAPAYDELIRHRLTPMVSDLQHLPFLSESARKQDVTLGIHLKFDTGMHRLGLRTTQGKNIVSELGAMDSLELTGIASHFACADLDSPEDWESMTRKQIQRFSGLAREVRIQRPQIAVHIANSAGILRFSALKTEGICNFARPGIALYGNGFAKSFRLQPVLRLCSKITQLRAVDKGATVSYGACWQAKRPTKAAIVPIGYADGFPRNLSGKSYALIGGKLCPIIGIVSMDMLVVDVTYLKSVKVGDDIVLIGKQGDGEIRVDEIAGQCGMSEYEVSCGISKRVPRVYLEDSDGIS